jgi:enoyl-CoA hydratase
VTVERDDGILVEQPEPGLAVVSFARPRRANALEVATVRVLQRALEQLEADPAVRVVILTGQGAAFCAGLDLKSVLDEQGGLRNDLSASYDLQECFEQTVRQLRRSNKVSIAAVNGAAVGAGFAIAAAADIRIAARAASFHVGAVRIGLSAGESGLSYHLPRLVGASRAFELMLTGRPVQAEEAERIGLVAAVVDDAALLARAAETARLVLRNSPYAVRHTKRVMWANLDAGGLDAALELENRAQVLALMTSDFSEATRAFLEKRAPRFTGR